MKNYEILAVEVSPAIMNTEDFVPHKIIDVQLKCNMELFQDFHSKRDEYEYFSGLEKELVEVSQKLFLKQLENETPGEPVFGKMGEWVELKSKFKSVKCD